MVLNLNRIVIKPGTQVCCDICSADYTNSTEKGGFLFSRKGVCPICAPQYLKEVKEFGEEKYIEHYCHPDTSFRDFIYEMRRRGY